MTMPATVSSVTPNSGSTSHTYSQNSQAPQPSSQTPTAGSSFAPHKSKQSAHNSSNQGVGAAQPSSSSSQQPHAPSISQLAPSEPKDQSYLKSKLWSGTAVGVIVGLVALGITVYYGYRQTRDADISVALAAWEAAKDFRDACSDDQSLKLALSEACEKALSQPTKPPPIVRRWTKYLVDEYLTLQNSPDPSLLVDELAFGHNRTIGAIRTTSTIVVTITLGAITYMFYWRRRQVFKPRISLVRWNYTDIKWNTVHNEVIQVGCDIDNADGKTTPDLTYRCRFTDAVWHYGRFEHNVITEAEDWEHFEEFDPTLSSCDITLDTSYIPMQPPGLQELFQQDETVLDPNTIELLILHSPRLAQFRAYCSELDVIDRVLTEDQNWNNVEYVAPRATERPSEFILRMEPRNSPIRDRIRGRLIIRRKELDNACFKFCARQLYEPERVLLPLNNDGDHSTKDSYFPPFSTTTDYPEFVESLSRKAGTYLSTWQGADREKLVAWLLNVPSPRYLGSRTLPKEQQVMGQTSSNARQTRIGHRKRSDAFVARALQYFKKALRRRKMPPNEK